MGDVINNRKRIWNDLTVWFAENQPYMSLCVSEHEQLLKYGYSIPEGCIFASGKYILYSPDHVAYGYEIVILFPSDYPSSYPSVICTDSDLPPNLHRHILTGGQACLGLVTELYQIWSAGPNIDNFARNVISPFIAWQLHYETFGSAPPWGERRHGIYGYIDFFTDFISKITRIDPQTIEKLITQKNVPKKRRKCPCGAKRQFRYCHGKFIYPIRKIFHAYCNQASEEMKMSTTDFVLKVYGVIIACLQKQA